MPYQLKTPEKIIKYGGYVLAEKNRTHQSKCNSSFVNEGQRKYVMEKHIIPDGCGLVIKQGFVSKEVFKRTLRERFFETRQEILQEVLGENNASEIKQVINKAEEEIRMLTATPYKLQVADISYVHSRINMIVENMYAELSTVIKNYAWETYAKTYTRSVVAYADIIGNTNINPTILPHGSEIVDKACPWLDGWIEKEKKKLLDGIAEELNKQIHLQTTEKGIILSILIVGGLISLITLSFTSCDNQSKKAADDAAYAATVEALKDSFIENGATQYAIIVEEDEKTCETCGEISGQIFNIDDFDIGTTAPPFHPNCRCSIDIYIPEEIEEELEPEEETLYVTEQQLLDFGWHNITEELIKDLNFALQGI